MIDVTQLQPLCRLDEVSDPGTRGFSVQTDQGLKDIFIVRRGNAVFAYQNNCPHTGSPLDWLPDQFLNLDRSLIQCATHFALFRIEDGYCVSGPCVGMALSSFVAQTVDGWVYVNVKAALDSVSLD